LRAVRIVVKTAAITERDDSDVVLGRRTRSEAPDCIEQTRDRAFRAAFSGYGGRHEDPLVAEFLAQSIACLAHAIAEQYEPTTTR